METLSCCSKEGFCPTFGRELWGRQFRIVHGLEGTEAEIAHYQTMLGAADPVEAPQIASESQPGAVEVQSIKPGPKPPKGCNCGGMAIARRIKERQQEQEFRKRGK